MKKSDDENLLIAETPCQVDRCNAEFYGEFPYPFPASSFHSVIEPDTCRKFLNQNLGDYRHQTIAARPSIWVAGCGTNQAVITALKYPDAKVVASDLSSTSLGCAASAAGQLGLKNLELRRQSINDVDYEEAFDYVICTGVIHHNAAPEAALLQLRRALKRDGVLELMVYNRYHRIVNHAVQKAIRLMASPKDVQLQPHTEMSLTRRLIRGLKVKNLVSLLLMSQQGCLDPEVADALIQPVEHSYTVESLGDMANACGLRYVTPCVNEHDKAAETSEWYVDMPDAETQKVFDELDDERRWQVANLLLLEKSPMLWFYFQREDCGRRIPAEREINEAFLEGAFAKSKAHQRIYVRRPSHDYQLSPAPLPFPSSPPAASVTKIYNAVNGIKPMRRIFEELKIESGFGAVLRARLALTTSVHPYLIAV